MTKACLQLIRLPRLLFIAVAQWLMSRAVIAPTLQVYGFDPAPPDITLYLLLAATACIAAGGFVINDYFDLKADAINRPDRLVVTRAVSKTGAMHLYQALTGVGVVCGLALAYRLGSFTPAFIFIVIPGLLWFHAANYKRQFLTGNIIIAFVAALALFAVALVEIGSLHTHYGQLIYETDIPRKVYTRVGVFAAFAFLMTWIEALVSDLASLPGDREMEYRTLPVKWGERGGKLFLAGLIALTVAALAVAATLYCPFEGSLTIRYIAIGVVLPLLALLYLTARSHTAAEYRQAVTLTQFVMLTGLLYSLVFYYLLAKTCGIALFGLFIVQ